ncbi:MAG: AmmeMemoRadiSam system protein A [Fervidicoccaceae archaeon]|jgi:AmmeMemoRadiSam system protein A
MKVVEPEELTLEEGAYLVKKARESVETALKGGRPEVSNPPEKLLRPGIPFVTIYLLKKGEKELRGCIGYITAVKSLLEATIEVAREAAFNDPRFPPLTLREYPVTLFEVTVLSELRPMPPFPEERVKFVKIGKMGLMVRKGFFSGLLLPQVAVEEGWNEIQFLENTCLKAGLDPECWKDKDAQFFFFYGRIFEEESSFGEVIERKY